MFICLLHRNSRALNPIKDPSVRNRTSRNLSDILDRFPDVTDRVREGVGAYRVGSKGYGSYT
jgi:hypothetical protein